MKINERRLLPSFRWEPESRRFPGYHRESLNEQYKRPHSQDLENLIYCNYSFIVSLESLGSWIP